MRSNANKSEDRLFVRAGNTDFMSGTPFEQSSWCGLALPISKTENYSDGRRSLRLLNRFNIAIRCLACKDAAQKRRFAIPKSGRGTWRAGIGFAFLKTEDLARRCPR